MASGGVTGLTAPKDSIHRGIRTSHICEQVSGPTQREQQRKKKGVLDLHINGSDEMRRLSITTATAGELETKFKLPKRRKRIPGSKLSGSIVREKLRRGNSGKS